MRRFLDKIVLYPQGFNILLSLIPVALPRRGGVERLTVHARSIAKGEKEQRSCGLYSPR